MPAYSSARRGGVLIEFLVIAVVLLMVIFGGIEFGLVVFLRHFAGEGARVAARDAATKPGPLVLPANLNAMYVDPGVFDERFTVIDLADLRNPATGAPLGTTNIDQQFAVLPAVHSVLRTDMFPDTTTFPGKTLLRFRGALLINGGGRPTPIFGNYIVRVPDLPSANPVPLRRIVNPPAAMAADGTARFECWQWYAFTIWPFGGTGAPATLIYANVPPGFTAATPPAILDVSTTNRHGVRVRSFAVGRKEIQ